MKLLCLSDQESPYLWDYYAPGRLEPYDLLLSCGDLSASYLTFLATMSGKPLLYVHGNHDGGYAQQPPEGCVCIEDRLVTIKGLRILGLGGSILYSGGPHQYTERQMAWRIRRLWLALRRSGGADIVITHAPIQGYGDQADWAHRGFACFLPLLDRCRPQYWIHGHVHLNYSFGLPRVLRRGETAIVNAYERCVLDLPE